MTIEQINLLISLIEEIVDDAINQQHEREQWQSRQVLELKEKLRESTK